MCPDARRFPTLLAPAGSTEALQAAINAGADAIYVGLKGWSRGGVRNELSQTELHHSLDVVHHAGRQLQLAANIIPKPDEKAALLRQLTKLAERGLDAVIVNDAGFLRDVHRTLPELPLTASIGCGALNSADVLFYQELGATSIVLPGNLEPLEIADMKAKASVQLELMLHMVQEFIQLGRCWMPSYHNFHAGEAETPGGRLTGSVKRGGVGSCFKICQQNWGLFRGAQQLDQRLLPNRQLSRVTELTAFLDAGADIIKVQGRSLPAAQLGALVAQYRSAIDAWHNGQKQPEWGSAQDAAFVRSRTPKLPQMWTVKGR